MTDVDWEEFNKALDRAERHYSVEDRIIDAMYRAEKRGRRVTRIAMHPNAYKVWRATEIPAGDDESLEWAGILFTKNHRLRGGKFRVRTEEERGREDLEVT